jgi:hypothetical protein
MNDRRIKYLSILSPNLETIDMKIEKYALAENILLGLLPKFKGLSEKSAKKMVDELDRTSVKLTKHFFCLQELDLKKILKKEKKEIKSQKKEAKKAAIKEKINLMLGTEKPKDLIVIPEKTKTTSSKRVTSKSKNISNIKLSKQY